MKWEETARVLKQTELAPGIFDLRLETEHLAGEALPGQFVSLYSWDQSRLLPRPISICDARGKELRMVYRVAGVGTAEFSRLREGDNVRVLGPLGNGFPEPAGYAGKKVLLFGGGIGIPPMLFLARKLFEEKAEVTAVLGFRDANTFVAQDFFGCAEVLMATEDGSVGTAGNVLDAIREKGVDASSFSGMFACGPKPMLRAIKTFSAEQKVPCFLSVEERMACGVGACLGCVVKTVSEDSHSHVKNARVCKDGPVFLATEIEL